MLMAVVDILCIVMVSSPTTNPDVILLLWVCQTFGIMSLVVWVIVWPTIARVVRKGETVIVSSLFN